jgi:hypothetical protein
MIRKYDLAVQDFLRIDLNGSKIPMGFATPRREFGTQSELNPEDAVSLPPHGAKTVKLPSMVIQRTDWTESAERQRWTKVRKIKWNDDLNMVTQAQFPRAYDLSYQLDIWTKFRDDANILTAMTLTKFNRKYKGLTVDLGHPWGEKKVYLRVDGVHDLTELESDEEDREVRMTIDMLLEAWLPLPPVDVRTVRKVIEDVQIRWLIDPL